LIQDAEIPFLAASLDGLDRTNGKVYEIKCGRYAYRETAYWKSPPSYYTAQLQHILMITGFDEITYVAYRPKQKLIVLQIGRDSRYIRNLRATEECFAARLMKRGHRFQANFMGSFIA
jgi:predicted phage-related endonuclease